MIKLDRVSKVYPDGTQAVKNISFEVEDGDRGPVAKNVKKY